MSRSCLGRCLGIAVTVPVSITNRLSEIWIWLKGHNHAWPPIGLRRWRRQLWVSPLCFHPAHCLHTVTEDNPELLCSLNTAVLGVLENVLLSSQPGLAHTLLRTLAAGKSCHFFSNSVENLRLQTIVGDIEMSSLLVWLHLSFNCAQCVTQEHCGTWRAVCLQPGRPRPSTQ